MTAFAPASVGNMITGFDVLGFALQGPGDLVTVTALDNGPPGVHLGEVSFAEDIEDAEALRAKLSLDVETNIASFVVREIWRTCSETERPRSVRVDLKKGCGIGTGLGSSAASAAAAAFAGLSLLSVVDEKALLEFGLRGEALASGARHADNLAPSLLGGIVGVRALEPIDVFRIPVPKSLHCALFQPKVTVLTKEARSSLPSSIPLSDYVCQSANLASLVSALHVGDLERIGRSLQDVVTEPTRAPNIPAFSDLRRDAEKTGALGAGIAGSGPTVFALCEGKATAQSVLEAWSTRYSELGLGYRSFTSGICPHGARLL